MAREKDEVLERQATMSLFPAKFGSPGYKIRISMSWQ